MRVVTLHFVPEADKQILPSKFSEFSFLLEFRNPFGTGKLNPEKNIKLFEINKSSLQSVSKPVEVESFGWTSK